MAGNLHFVGYGKKQSAGILLYRVKEKGLEVFLVHPGGPFWKKKDAASWLIPKGEFPDDKDPLVAAIREFREEAGFTPSAPFAILPQPMPVLHGRTYRRRQYIIGRERYLGRGQKEYRHGRGER